MKYYGIFLEGGYKVVKRNSPMTNDKTWLRMHYGETAHGYESISIAEYLYFRAKGQEIQELITV